MIKTILIIFVIFMALAILAAWVLSGGISRIAEGAAGFTNFFTFGTPTGSGVPAFELPWQVSVPQGPNINQLDIGQETDLQAMEEQVNAIETEIRKIEQEVTAQPY